MNTSKISKLFTVAAVVVVALTIATSTAYATGPTPYQCRIMDTRGPAYGSLGVLSSNFTYSFALKAPVTSQNAAAGCALPSTATFAWLTITVIAPVGGSGISTGYIQTWPWGQANPGTISFSYPALGAGQIFGGSVLVPLCIDTSGSGGSNCDEDYKFLTSQPINAVVDIVAYQ